MLYLVSQQSPQGCPENNGGVCGVDQPYFKKAVIQSYIPGPELEPSGKTEERMA